MKYSLIATSLAAASVALAVPLEERSSGGFLALPISHTRNIKPFKDLIKRDGSDIVSLANKFTSYNADLGIGSNAQKNTVAIDTGSSDLWVYSSSVSQAHTSYDSSSSSSYHYNNSDFSINYVSGSASGDWVTDTIVLGSASIKSQSFGDVDTYTEDTGVFGIGFISGESDADYINIPQNLVDQGYISSNAYSLYLDDKESSTGSILFGAVDSAKYTGNLYTVDLLSSNTFETTISSITVNGETVSSSFPGILDSGTSFTYLPSYAASGIASALGATYNAQYGVYTTSSVPDTNVVYSFNGAIINVPAKEILLEELTGVSGLYGLAVFSNSESSGYTLLGDTFLRSAYVVYDLDNLQVSLAQSSWDSSSSNVHVIDGSVPGASPAPGA